MYAFFLKHTNNGATSFLDTRASVLFDRFSISVMTLQVLLWPREISFK